MCTYNPLSIQPTPQLTTSSPSKSYLIFSDFRQTGFMHVEPLELPNLEEATMKIKFQGDIKQTIFPRRSPRVTKVVHADLQIIQVLQPLHRLLYQFNPHRIQIVPKTITRTEGLHQLLYYFPSLGARRFFSRERVDVPLLTIIERKLILCILFPLEYGNTQVFAADIWKELAKCVH